MVVPWLFRSARELGELGVRSMGSVALAFRSAIRRYISLKVFPSRVSLSTSADLDGFYICEHRDPNSWEIGFSPHFQKMLQWRGSNLVWYSLFPFRYATVLPSSWRMSSAVYAVPRLLGGKSSTDFWPRFMCGTPFSQVQHRFEAQPFTDVLRR